jgi:pimeloyl-ACP methyl ester carboxylesterase
MVQQLLEEPPLSVLSTLDLSVLRHDQIDALPLLRGIPVHVVSGDGDHLSWEEHALQIAGAVGPSANVTVLPRVGHALNQTRPTEVNAAIEQVLAAARGRTTVSELAPPA